MTKRTLAIAILPALVLVLAACGSSSSKAPGVQTAPSGGLTSDTSAASTATTSTTSTSAVSTPAALSRKPSVVVPKGAPPKHLVTKDLVTGTGATAKAGSSVTVNYVGVLYSNGKEFDSSWKRGQPLAPFTLGQGSVIPGWDKGLVGMKVGGRRELIIPPNLAYGTKSQTGIPANSTLVFVVDLLAAN